MNQRAVTDTISQLQMKGDVFTRQIVIEQRRIEDINAVSQSSTADCLAPMSIPSVGLLTAERLHGPCVASWFGERGMMPYSSQTLRVSLIILLSGFDILGFYTLLQNPLYSSNTTTRGTMTRVPQRGKTLAPNPGTPAVSKQR